MLFWHILQVVFVILRLLHGQRWQILRFFGPLSIFAATSWELDTIFWIFSLIEVCKFGASSLLFRKGATSDSWSSFRYCLLFLGFWQKWYLEFQKIDTLATYWFSERDIECWHLFFPDCKILPCGVSLFSDLWFFLHHNLIRDVQLLWLFSSSSSETSEKLKSSVSQFCKNLFMSESVNTFLELIFY